MSYFLRQGSRLSVTDEANLDVFKSLPVGNYTVKHNPMTGFYLEMVDAFPNPGKIYGQSTKWAGRILDTFRDRPNSTGVLLSGEKGSGKTLLAKTISQMAAGLGYPTLTINQSLHGEDFNKFIQDIDVPAVIIFDEFEKIYNDEAQQELLTLFDGMYPTKKLFVMTCNNKWRIDSHMRNRPGRIYYALDFSGLDADFIREYCEDNLNNKSHIDSVCRASFLFSQFNFDMLKALVEEMNRYDEPAQDAMFLLNAKPQGSDESTYDLTVEVGDRRLTQKEFTPNIWSGNPMGRAFVIHLRSEEAEKKTSHNNNLKKVARRVVPANDDYFDENPVVELADARRSTVGFEPEEHLVSVDPKSGAFLFKNGNVTVTMTRKPYGDDNYYTRLF